MFSGGRNRELPPRLALALAVSAGALAALLVVSSSSPSPSAALLQRRSFFLPHLSGRVHSQRSRSLSRVRAPGDDGVGGHGIGGQICFYQLNKESGLGEWACPPSEGTMAASTEAFPQMAQMRRRNTLYDFGSMAPAGGYAYPGALPPTDWGDENFDGKNFAAFSVEDTDMTGIPSYVHMDGDYWESVHGGAPTALPFDLDEGVGPIFSDDSWNPNIWCTSGVCDITEDTSPGSFDLDNYAAPVGYRPSL